MNARNKFFTLLVVLLVASATYYFATTDRSSDYVLIGTVDANQIAVGAQIGGRIDKLNVDDGTFVHAGDVIAEIDPTELRAQQQAAVASFNSAQTKIAETEADRRLAAGETRNTVAGSQARLATAEAQLQQAQATLVKVQQDTERTMGLEAQGVASKQDADRARADLAAQRAAVAALQKQVDAARSDVAVAQAGTNQAVAAAHTVAESRAQAQNAKALLDQMQTRLGYTNVVAPVSGFVTTRVVRPGEVVAAGAPVVTITDLSDTWVYAAAPETQAVNIAVGDPLTVRLPNGQMLTGKVSYKAAAADFATQRDVGRTKRDIKSVALKVAVDNSKSQLVPGMTAEVLVPKSKQGGPR